MNGLDLLLAVLLLLPVLAGMWRGILQPVAFLAGLVAGGFLGFRYAPALAEALFGAEEDGWAGLLVFVIVFFGTILLFALLARLLDGALRTTGLKLLDRAAGAVAGALVGLGLATMTVVAGAALLPSESDLLGDSLLAPRVLQAAKSVRYLLPERMQERYRKRLEETSGETVGGSGAPQGTD